MTQGKNRQASAEIEVTPEMVEAGWAEYVRWLENDDLEDYQENAAPVGRIIRVALEAVASQHKR